MNGWRSHASRRANRRWRTGLALCALAVPVHAAAQQVVDTRMENDTAASRLRPEYDQPGIPAATFLLFPTLSAEAAYNDNIYARSDIKTGDATLVLRPAINVRSQWSRNQFDVIARGEFDLSGLHQRRQQRHLVHFCGVAGELERRDPAIRLQRAGLFLGHAVGRRQVRQQRLSRSARQRQQQRLRRRDVSGDVHEHHVCRWRGVLSLRHL